MTHSYTTSGDLTVYLSASGCRRGVRRRIIPLHYTSRLEIKAICGDSADDGFLGFHAKTATLGLIEATPAKRGVGADRRFSLSEKPFLKPEPTR